MKVKCFRYREIAIRLNNEENSYIRLIGEKIFNDSLINHNIESIYDFVKLEKKIIM